MGVVWAKARGRLFRIGLGIENGAEAGGPELGAGTGV